MKGSVKKFSYPIGLFMVVVLAGIIFIWAELSPAASTETPPPAKVRKSLMERTEARITDLQKALNITPAQEELWKALTQIMKDNAKTQEDLIKERIEKSKEMNAVDDLKSFTRISEAQVAGMKSFMPAFEALYNSMSDDQKKNADVLFKMGRQGRHKKK